VPGHARFAVNGWSDYLELPIRVRDAMLRQIDLWRGQEKSK
jgi:hypothetical protein